MASYRGSTETYSRPGILTSKLDKVDASQPNQAECLQELPFWGSQEFLLLPTLTAHALSYLQC